MLRLIRKVCWVAIIGLMIAFHNTYNQVFKTLDDTRQEVIAEDEEED